MRPSRAQAHVGSSSMPRADRVADPPGLVGHELAAHHQRHRPDGRVPTQRRRRQDHAVRPERRARSRIVTVSMLSTRSWNRWVCTTHPWLTVDPVLQVDQVRLRQPVGLAPHPAPDPRTQRRAARRSGPACRSRVGRTTARRPTRRRCRPARCATRTSSTAGGSPTRSRPTSIHFASVVTTAASGRGRDHDQPAQQSPPPTSRPAAASAVERHDDAEPDRDADHHRDQPAQLDQSSRDDAAAWAGRTCGCLSTVCRDPAQLGRRAAQPGRARLRLVSARRGGQHGDQPPLGHLAARSGHPGVADERVLADLHVLDAQPAAAELVAAEQRVVGEERALAARSSAWGSAAPSTPRPRGPTSAPSARSQAGVSELE